jgi:hypothetical protein
MEGSYSLYIKSDDRIHLDHQEIIQAIHDALEKKIKAMGDQDPALYGFRITLSIDANHMAKKFAERHDLIRVIGKKVRIKQ